MLKNVYNKLYTMTQTGYTSLNHLITHVPKFNIMKEYNSEKIRLLADNVTQRLSSISTEEVSLAIMWLFDKLQHQQAICDNDVAELCIALTRLQANVHILKEAFNDLSTIVNPIIP